LNKKPVLKTTENEGLFGDLANPTRIAILNNLINEELELNALREKIQELYDKHFQRME
jgi:hypothetical protein